SLHLCTIITPSKETINTLIDSGATDNFINEAWAALAPGPPWRLLIPICLRLFDGNASFVGDITHFVRLPITFANGQQQELWLLVTKLHAFALLILGLCSTNPWINWQSLTLHFERNTTPSHTPVSFKLPASPQILRAPGDPGEESPMHSSLRSSSARSFVINTRLGDSPELLELQLFDEHPTPSGPITKSHSSTLTLDNSLQFLVNFLVRQLHELTPIVLGLPWLHNINPDINWATLTMKFDTPRAELAAAIHLLPLPDLDDTEPQDTSNTPEPRLSTPLPAPAPCPPNIPCNKYKGPNYPT
ncbi:hypothetical protein C0992_001481, partial [Termitomyces sp. T32_za158]